MWASKDKIDTKYIDLRSISGKTNERIAAIVTGNNIHGNISHLVLLI